MARLVYTAITSLDGYIEDASGRFDWAVPDEGLHRFVNDLERPIGTHLYGRRMYETMAFWQDPPDLAAEPDYVQDYARIWQAAAKVVFSRTLAEATTPRTRLEREFEPAAIRAMKASAESDMSVGGAELAARALGAGLVDEIHLFLNPVTVGGGKPALPRDERVDLVLLDELSLGNGVVHLHYRTKT